MGIPFSEKVDGPLNNDGLVKSLACKKQGRKKAVLKGRQQKTRA